jgi:hypothetical protein
MTWDISIPDGTVLAPMPGPLPPDVQGRWQAANPGQATITANGRPVCNPGEACAQFIVHFQATVLVTGGTPAPCSSTHAPTRRSIAGVRSAAG